MFVVRRSEHNPIITPNSDVPWKAYAAFNGCPIETDEDIKLVYRAVAQPQKFENQTFLMSTVGIADSVDGVHFENERQLIVPKENWERYGCEDPRVTRLKGKYYIFYTALSTFPFTPQGIKVAVAISDDLKTIKERHLVTPFNTKAMALFPEKINGKFVAVLTALSDQEPQFGTIAIAEFDREEDMWSPEYWKNWFEHIRDHEIMMPRNGKERMEVGAVPIKTKEGWLLIYSRIQNHNSSPVFGVEAVLLDSRDPRKVIATTRGPFLVPQNPYEKYGILPNIVFPSGAYVDRSQLHIYYGGADTVCATASVRLTDLLRGMIKGPDSIMMRYKKNPILTPTDKTWEKRAVFNPAVIDTGKHIQIVYRAMSEDNTSTMGLAVMKNAKTVSYRSEWPIYIPRESFESKGVPNGNSGCEDPRLTQIGNRIYMCYTAYNGKLPPAVALTSISVHDFEQKHWLWSKPVIISPTGIDDKDACLLPAGKDENHFLIHRIDNAICLSEINPHSPLPPVEYRIILRPRPGMWDGLKVGLSAPPILTRHGWLMVYHGVSESSTYRVGLALLDREDPSKVIGRTTGYIFEPKEKYEKEGQVKNVVFPCGAVIRGRTFYMYYGGADTVIGLATGKVKKLLNILSPEDL